MTFHSSCSYAGLANLLSFYGIDTEDWKIALRMHLPYLFAHEDGGYLSGPMLQGAKWFNLYLNPRGFAFSECQHSREEVCAVLQTVFPAMLGIRVSPENKHAVIYTGCRDGKYRFLNNKRRDSPEPEALGLTEEELFARLDESVVVGHLERTDPAVMSFRSCLENSFLVLQSLQAELNAFCGKEQSAAALRESMNTLFRPILLDGVTMLELLEESEIATALKKVRTQFLNVIKGKQAAVLADKLDMTLLNDAVARYEALIRNHMEENTD